MVSIKKNLDGSVEKNFLKHYLILSSGIYVLMVITGLVCSLAIHNGLWRFVFLCVVLVVSHLTSLLLPFQLQWYWQEAVDEVS